MAAGWFHQTHDLIVFGRIYFHIHREKDAPSQKTPGRRHREVGHEWYQEYRKLWDHDNPFPPRLWDVTLELREAQGADAAEEQMAALSHDYLDRIWDELPREARSYWQGRFVCLLYHPEILESWAGVNVIRGRIRRITANGQEKWEESPETAVEYRRLRREVSRHQKSRLRDVVAKYC